MIIPFVKFIHKKLLSKSMNDMEVRDFLIDFCHKTLNY